VKDWREAGMPDDWIPLTTPNLGASARKCRRHDWIRRADVTPEWYDQCGRCGKRKDDTAARRGRNNRARGNSIEREVGKRLGLRRVGQYGGPDDLSGELFAAQVKSGGAFSERLWSWLKAVPVNAGQTALLVVTDAPGPGHRRRAMVILDIGDWEALHAGTPEAA
jgi:hypothetical protein